MNYSRKILVLLLSFIILSLPIISVVHAQTTDSYEPDNSFNQYSSMTVTTEHQLQVRSIAPAGDNDFIRFSAVPGRYIFYTESFIDLHGFLYDSNLNLLIEDDDSQGDSQFKITYNIVSAGYYFLRVNCDSNVSIGDYVFHYYYELGSLVISPSAGPGGLVVEFSGVGYPASSSVAISYYDSWFGTWNYFTSVTASPTGGITFAAEMPDLKLAVGPNDSYYDNSSTPISFRANVGSTVYCYSDFNEYARGIKTVGTQTASGLFGNGTDLTYFSIKPGDTLPLSGQWFHSSSVIYIRWDSVAVVGTVTNNEWANAQIIGTSIASQTGSFQTTISIPEAETGQHYISIEDSQTRVILKVTLEIGSLTISPYYGPGGIPLTITGSSYPPSTSVTISYYDPLFGTWNYFTSTTSNSTGDIALSIQSPDLKRSVGAGDNYEASDSISFRSAIGTTVYGYSYYSEYSRGIKTLGTQTASGLFGNGTNLALYFSVQSGESIPISGRWFHSSSVIYVRWDGNAVVGTVTSDAWNNAAIIGTTIASQTGAFEAVITIPQAQTGEHYISIEDSQTRVIIKVLVSIRGDWDHTYGTSNMELLGSVTKTDDGGYASVGMTNSSGNNDVWLVKTNSLGNVLWSNSYGGTGSDGGLSIIQDTDGGLVIAGLTSSFGYGGNDAYLIKTDSYGNLLWQKSYGGTNTDNAVSVIQDTDGGFVLAGTTQSFGYGGSDAYLVKTDSSGNLIWQKTFGGTGSDYGYSVISDNYGQLVMVGYTASFGAGGSDVFLVKTDSSGNLIWQKTFGGTGTDNGYDLIKTETGRYAIVGSTTSFGAGSSDAYVIKTDSDGNLLWSKTFGLTRADSGNSILENSAGEFVVAGSITPLNQTSSDVLLLKLDLNGNYIANKTFGGTASDLGRCVIPSGDGSYVIGAYTNSFGSGNNDFWLIKTSALNINSVHNLNTGLSYGSIQQAINAAETQNGHTIQVDNGVYYENVIIHKSVILRGQNNQSTIIEGLNTGNVISVTVNNVEISGFTIQATYNYQYSGVNVGAVTGANISNNIFQNNYYAISLTGSSYSTISKNQIPESNTVGINVDSSSYITLIDNKMTNQSTYRDDINIFNSNVNLINCNITNYSNIYGNATATINNSVLTYLSIQDQANVSIYDSSIYYLYTNFLTNNLFLSNSTLQIFYAYQSNFYLKGDFSIIGSGYFYWTNSSITRDFTFTIKDTAVNNIQNADLTLRNQTGNIIWSGQSDINGKATFSFTFTDSNYQNGLTIQALKQDLGSSMSFNFFSNSAIVLTLHLPSVHNINTGLSYFTIQEAINANLTQNGHTIIVDKGTYVESIMINKSIKLQGENSASTIITRGTTGSAITIMANNVDITGFTISTDATGIGYGYYYGIYVIASTNININNNIIRNFGNYGINVENSSFVTVLNNIMSHNQGGVVLFYSTNNKISNNSLNQNDFAIGMLNCSSTIVSENKIVGIQSSSVYGLIFYTSQNITTYGNNVGQNQYGILLYELHNSTMNENRIVANIIGMELMNSSGNLIYHNVFLGNTKHIEDQTPFVTSNINTWDNGYPSGGNFWSNYTGTDSNHDGIGDTPYTIDSNNTDRYPLVYASNSFNAGEYNGTQADVNIISNSTVSNFQIEKTDKIITLKVTGENETSGFAVITLPNSMVIDLWKNIYSVYLDGQLCNFQSWFDENNTYIYVNYTHSEHLLAIEGDITPPVTVNDYDGLWHTSDFIINLSATDLNGIKDTYYKINNGPTQSVSVNGQPQITTENAANTLEYWSVDMADNEETHTILIDIKIDKTAPTGAILINSGAPWATSTSVSLELTAVDSLSSVSQVRFSNDGSTWTAWETASVLRAWSLIAGDGTKTVYYQIKDNAGLTSIYSDTIVLDTTLPTGSILINNGQTYTTSNSVTLTLSYSDSASGVSQVRYSNDGSTWSTWESAASTKVWTLSSGDGTKTIYYQTKDNAGLTSISYSDSIILDTTLPTGSIVINNGDASISSPSATLTLTYSDSGSGVSQVRYSNDGSTWSTWENAAASKAWTLSAGDGSKTVYYQIIDAAGLISSTYSDTILLQTPTPTPAPTNPPAQTSNPTTSPTAKPTNSPTPTAIPTVTSSPTPTPTTKPTETPQQTDNSVLLYAAAGAAIALVVVVAALYMLKKRK